MLLLGVDFWFILNNVWVRNPGQTTICSSNPYNECGIYSVDHMFSIAVGTVKLIRGNCGHFFCITIFERHSSESEKERLLGTCLFTAHCG